MHRHEWHVTTDEKDQIIAVCECGKKLTWRQIEQRLKEWEKEGQWQVIWQ